MLLRLGRYLLRETAGLYLLGVAAFCLLISIDLLSVLASFLIEQGATLATVGRLLLYKLPWFLHLTLPIAVVFAVLLATGRLAKDSELKAAYTLGAPPSGLLGPLVLFGLLVSGVSLLNNGYLEPHAERAYRDLIDTFIYVRPPAEVQTDVSYHLDSGDIFHAARVRADLAALSRASLSGVLVIQADGTLLSAPSGLWDSEEGVWRLQQTTRTPPGGAPSPAGEVVLPFQLEADATATLARSETLTLGELRRQIGSQQRLGGEVRQLRFQFHRRVADAMAAVIFALGAGALGLNLRSRAAGFGWTIALLVVFWAVWFLSENLYETGVLGAFAAAWFTFALVGAGSLALALWSVRR